MSVEEFREQMAELLHERDKAELPERERATCPSYLGLPPWAIDRYLADADTILDLELLPGITLKRLAELKDKLVVLDADQVPSFESFPDWASFRDVIARAGFKRVSPLGEKEG